MQWKRELKACRLDPRVDDGRSAGRRLGARGGAVRIARKSPPEKTRVVRRVYNKNGEPRKPMGRPVLPLKKLRGSLSVRLSPEERALLDEAALQSGKKLTQWRRAPCPSRSRYRQERDRLDPTAMGTRTGTRPSSAEDVLQGNAREPRRAQRVTEARLPVPGAHGREADARDAQRRRELSVTAEPLAEHAERGLDVRPLLGRQVRRPRTRSELLRLPPCHARRQDRHAVELEAPALAWAASFQIRTVPVDARSGPASVLPVG
jgi:hypothetical protein